MKPARTSLLTLLIATAIFGLLLQRSSSVTAQAAGKALQFNGTNQYVTFGAAPGLGAGTFTLELWFKRTGPGTGVTTGSGGIPSAIPLLTKGRGEAEGSNVDMNYFLGIDASSGKLVADFEEGPSTGGSPGSNHPVSGTSTIANNVWYHAAATYDGQTWKLYLNGVQDGTVTLAAPRPPRSDSIQHAALGTAMTSTGAVGGFFAGVVDEPRIWNYARSGADISSNKDQEIASAPGLIGRWGLNEGSGTTANDSAGSNSGTLAGTPVWVTGLSFDHVPPEVPVGVEASPGNGLVTLAWAPSADGDLNGYNVYRADNPGVQVTGTPLNGATPIASALYTDRTVTNGLTYYYALTAVDTSGNASSGSAEVSTTADAFAGSAVQLNGTNQYVTFGPAPALGSATLTLETWFKRTGTGVGVSTGGGGITSAVPLISKGRGEGDGSNVDMNYFLGIDSTTGALVADFEDAESGFNHPVSGVTSIPVSTTAWHHAAVTYDGSTWRLYLDGTLESQSTVGAITPRSDSIQHAGLGTAMTSTGAAAGFFAGILDEVRIWNYARSQGQIQATKNLEIPAAPGLLGRWGLNEATGAIAGNTAGTTLNGTLMAASGWVAGYPFTADSVPPAAPQNLTAAAGNSVVALTWSANTEGDLAGYNVYRSTTTPVSTAGAPLNGATLLTGASFNDAAVINGTTYYYVVTALDIFANVSASSAEADALPQVSNQAPVVNAGPDRAAAVNGDVTLAGTATDDGLPGPLTITWSQESGPGTATFSAPGAATTTASFSTPGAYALRLTASDGALTTNDVVLVTVSDPVLVGAGDLVGDCIAGGPGAVTNAEATAALLDGISGAVFTLGDNAYQDGTAQQFATCYGPTWGRHKARTRPVTGNHDYNTANATGYFDYFNGVGVADGPAGPRPDGYYSYDLPNWHVVVLNSECTGLWDPNGCGPTSAQYQWLVADLAASPTNNIIALWHRPLYSSTSAPSTHPYLQPLWQALYAGGVDLVLGGHWHNYERLGPLNATGAADAAYGIRSFVVGSGGVNHTGFGTVLPTSEVRDATTFGVLKLTLHASSYDWQFVPVAGQSFTDSGTGAVHGAPPVPTVTGVTPASGPATGGTVVTVTGANFGTGTSATTVRFGAAVATSVTCATSTTCTATSPAGSGTVDVTATVGTVTSAADPAARFTYAQVNQAPVVNAGPDQSVVLPGAVTLAGTVADDGLPGGLTVTWTKVGGPGTVTFADANAASTSATVAGAGVYTLRLTASDGVLTTSDDVAVTVTSAGNNALAFSGTSNYVTFGAVPGLGAAQFTLETWFKRTGTGTGTNTGTGGIADIIPLIAKGRAEADRSTLDMNYILGIKAATGTLAADFEDMATGANHPVLGTTPIPVSPTAWHHVAATYDGTTWRLYLDGALEAQLTVGDFTPRADSIQHASLATGLNSTGVAAGDFAGVLDEARIWNYARSAAQIAGGLNRSIPTASGLLGRWGLDDACAATIVDSSGNNRTGTMVGTLTCVAGAPPLPGSLNQAPVVDAGADQSVTLPATVNLTGVVTDDALTGGSTLAWTKSSGPGAVTFGSPTAATTTAAFSAPGAYVLALTASDGELTSSDSLTVTVSTEVPVNQPPVVNAGPDQTITLPAVGVLSGSASDDGLPGTGMTAEWSIISGPGGVTFSDPEAPVTNATFASAGVYTLRLTASDGLLITSDSVTVTVNSASGSYALDLNGTSGFVTFGRADALGASRFTLETWFKREGAGVSTSTGSGGVTAVPLVTKGRAENDGSNVDMNYFLGIDGASGRLVADFEEGAGGPQPGLNHPVTGSSMIQHDVWYHAAATYDGATWRLYLNGALEAQLAVGQLPRADSIQHAALGTAMTSTGAAAGFFNGTIDEARIWNHARGQQEIQSGMTAEIVASPGLIGRWGLNEGSGAAVGDTAGGVTGTATGIFSWVGGAPFRVNLPPAAPVVVVPAAGATGIGTSPTLDVTVSDPDGDPMTVTFYGREAPAVAVPDFTIVALPDTQHYSDDASRWPTFTAQTQWIVANRDPMNIAFVSHLGDIVENIDAQPIEWTRADTSMSVLDTNLVPYGLAPGNHDMSSAGISSYYDQHFPVSRFQHLAWYGGYLGQDALNDPIDRQYKDNYELFSVGGLDFIAVHLEYDMPDYAVAWADRILKQHPNRRAIVSTHLFLNTSNARPSTVLNRPNGTSAEAVWQQLIRTNCNVFLVLNGHYPGEGNRTDLNSCGQPVHQLLADYQSRANGGDGWLRYMRFKPSENKIYVYTYSPTRNAGAGEFETDANSQFVLDYNMQGTAYAPLGSVSGVASGAHGTKLWPGLAAGRQYEWYVTVSDGAAVTTGPSWGFTTAGNSAPIVTSPGDQASAEGAAISLQVQASDPDGDTLTYGATGLPSGLTIDVGTGLISGTVAVGAAAASNVTITASDALATGSTAFTWTVTRTNRAPAVTNPGAQSSVEGTSVSLTIEASDPDGDALSYSAAGLPAGLALNGSGVITGTVSFTAAGAHEVTVTATDGRGGSGSAAFVWTVTGTNRPPTITNPGSRTSAEGASVSLQVVGTDPDGDALAYSAAGLPQGLAINGATGLIGGTIGYTAAGTTSAEVTVNDSNGGTASATFAWTVTDTNRAPVASDASYSTPKNRPVSAGLTATDADGNGLTFAVVSQPRKGTVTITNSATGLFTYTPSASASGSDAFTFKANDSQADSNLGTITIKFTQSAGNTAPVASNGTLTMLEDLSSSGALVAVDGDGNPLTYRIVTNGTKGVATITNASTGSYTYVPATNQHGSDSFTFRANDGVSDSNVATVSVSITAVNDPPVASSDSATTALNTAVTIAVLANDTDPDLDSLSIVSVSQPAAGSVTFGVASVTYTPPLAFTGPATFTYVASDPSGAPSNSATVTVAVAAPVNVAPVANNLSITVARNVPFSGVVTATDANGDTLTYRLVTSPKKGTVSLDGAGAFTYVASGKGSDSFTFRANDGSAESNTARVTINIQ